MSFERIATPKIDVQNKNVAFPPNPIPPPPSQKSIFRTEKMKIEFGIRPTLIINCMDLKPVKFERNPTKIKNTSLRKIIFKNILGMKMLNEDFFFRLDSKLHRIEKQQACPADINYKGESSVEPNPIRFCLFRFPTPQKLLR